MLTIQKGKRPAQIWRMEFRQRFIRRTQGRNGFQYELMDPTEVLRFIRHTLGELLAEIPDKKLQARLTSRWV